MLTVLKVYPIIRYMRPADVQICVCITSGQVFSRVANPRDFPMMFTDISTRNSAGPVSIFQYILLISEHIEMR